MRDNVKIFTDQIITLNGITSQKIKTLGYISTHLYFGNVGVSQTLHVVPDSINIPSDGLLGRDFLKNYKCVINYENSTLSFQLNNFFLEIDILQSPNGNSFVLPARCETYRTLKFNINSENPQLVDSQNIADGVFVARTIVDKDNSLVRILNTTDKTQIINLNEIKMQSLDDYFVYSFEKVENNPERTRKLTKILENEIPAHAKQTLLPLCIEYADVFALEGDPLSVNNFYEQRLRLIDNSPVYIKNYRNMHSQRDEINRQVKQLLDNDVIEPSESNFNSPLLLVPKKSLDNTESWRLCVDFRSVNKKLIADKFPLPRIDDIFDNLGQAKFFSVIDLFSGFWQVPLHPDSRDVTSFSTDSGAFRWKVLPFGLNVAPNSFARMMQIAFSGLEPNQAFLYMDDIIVIGRTERQHISNIRKVFNVLRRRNLKINPKNVISSARKYFFWDIVVRKTEFYPVVTKLTKLNHTQFQQIRIQ